MPATTHSQVEDDAADIDTEMYRQRLGLLTAATLSKILGLELDTLKRWRAADKGPPYLKIGTRIWYRYADVEHWLVYLTGGETDDPKA